MEFYFLDLSGAQKLFLDVELVSGEKMHYEFFLDSHKQNPTPTTFSLNIPFSQHSSSSFSIPIGILVVLIILIALSVAYLIAKKRKKRGRTSLLYGRCSKCGSKVFMPFRCNYCGNYFCDDHRLPSNHDCIGLGSWKNTPPPSGVSIEYLRGGKFRAKETGWREHRFIKRKRRSGRVRKIVIAIAILALSFSVLYIKPLFDTRIFEYKNIEESFKGIYPIDKPKCEDGTVYGSCSINKPYYCLNGTLVKKASICGCSKDEVAKGDDCRPKYETDPVEITLNYVLRGETKSIRFTAYGGLKSYLASIPRYYYCTPECPSDRELELRFLNEEKQYKYLVALVEEIKKRAEGDDQARIAISLVQNIPYDYESLRTGVYKNRYPYEVIYDKKGICAEKSRLLAFILRELGYGVVLFEFEVEDHMAVGIKCPMRYSYRNSSYCFIETTSPTIVTYSEGEYVGAGKLRSMPEIIFVSDGKSFESVWEEYNDAQEFIRLEKLAEASGGYLDQYNYYRWWEIVKMYGIEVEER
ncbi:MAG: hypothetical protein PWQ22_531 [Archaeoglobaceae archaeon]|nr:hypothetical protein [Archaeoglobaceae archaeon]MDK2876121.1 hypothetical protein [Archaeoglobaceae archaeon]